MNELQTFRRLPSIKCWITHILNGKYSDNNKFLYTIFGQIKRIRIVTTIVDKKEILNNQQTNDEDFLEEENPSNVRIEFYLDDGTGLIRATLWSANPDDYSEYNKGDKIELIGMIKYWNGFISISPEIIRKLEDPNFSLLHDLEIIKRIRKGDLQEIPDINDPNFEFENNIDEIDVDSLFKEESSEYSDLKDKIYLLIEEHTLNGEGISLQNLLDLLHISENELKENLKNLEIESKIYQSEDNIYQSY